jgi:hypothetical protein
MTAEKALVSRCARVMAEIPCVQQVFDVAALAIRELRGSAYTSAIHCYRTAPKVSRVDWWVHRLFAFWMRVVRMGKSMTPVNRIRTATLV